MKWFSSGILLLLMTSCITSCSGPGDGSIPYGRKNNPDATFRYIEARTVFFDSHPREKLSHKDFANQRCKIIKSTPYTAYRTSSKKGWTLFWMMPITEISRDVKVWCQ